MNDTQQTRGQTGPKGARHLAVVDDNPCIHAAVREQFAQSGEAWQVSAYHNGAAALKAVAAALPQVVLMDIGMPEMNGIECAHRLKLQLPQLPVVMLTGKAQPERVLNALRVGARGYLVKTPSLKDLMPLVSKAIAGGLALCPTAERLLLEAMNQSSLAVIRWGLTRREEEVLTCLCRYGPEKDVADALGISRNTAHVHVARIFQKLGVHDRSAAVREFRRTLPGGGSLYGLGWNRIT